ncbi:MAG: SpoIIE family protein phosphatase [Proteobacteria bacterium]|nr:SpoIIE family protein phosphatase [Pseudomonadota bacterium]
MKQVKNPMDAVFALSQAIARSAEPEQVYDLILDEVVRSLGVEKASIMIFDESRGVLTIAAARGMDSSIMKDAVVKVGEGISGRVFASHEPLMINEIQASEMGPGRERYRTRSLISAPVTCFPMKVGEESLGVINVTDRTDGRPFTEEDQRLLTTITNQAAAYMHILKLTEERAENERLRQQIEIARQIQYRLLPAEQPSIEGLDVAGRLITAERVGGDYYDCFLTQARRPSFVVADVSGHSIGAALIMAAFRSAIRAQRDGDYSPSMLVQRINSILYEDLFQSEQFITMAYMQYVVSRRIIQYTTAGHPHPIVWRTADKKFEDAGTDDPILGLEPRGVFHEKQMVVSSGDVVLLYTDGIIEAGRAGGERFGRERLKECMRDAVVGSARQIVDVIVESAQSFADPDPLRDDVTALAVKVL